MKVWMKKTGKVFSVALLLFLSMFSGCINPFQTGSCKFISYEIIDDDGYAALRVEVNATSGLTLKLFDPFNNPVGEKQLENGVQTVTIDLAESYETPADGSYTLKVYNGGTNVVTKKSFVVTPTSLSISDFRGIWWKEGVDSYSLIEVVLSIENNGNAPVYLKEMNVTVDGVSSFTAPIFNGTVEGKTSKGVASSFYVPDLDESEHVFVVKVFDYSGNVLVSKTFSEEPYYDSAMKRFSLSWKYKWRSFSISLPLPAELLSFYSSIKRPVIEDYSFYVISPYDDSYVDLVTRRLISLFNGEDEELIDFVASFVQSIPYAEEEGEYPQFPIELLNNGSGDCEDKAIFASSILYNLGYDVALLRFPEHMAVGVHLSDATYDGRIYYEDESGKRYLFLETSNTAWTLGNADLEYRHASNFTLYHVTSKPVLVQECKPPIRYTSVVKDYIKVDTNVKNIGTKDAENVYVSAAFLTQYGMVINGEESSHFTVAAGRGKRISFKVDYPDITVVKVYVRVVYKDKVSTEATFVFS